MKKILAIAGLLCICSNTLLAQKTATVKGFLKNLGENSWVYLRSVDQVYPDSAQVKNGQFTFKLKIDSGNGYKLSVKGHPVNSNIGNFYLQQGTLELRGEKDNLHVLTFSGDKFANDLNAFHKTLYADPLFAEWNSLWRKGYSIDRKGPDSVLLKEISKRYGQLFEPVDSIRTELAKKWLKENPASDINAWVLYQFFYVKRPPFNIEESALNHLSANANRSKLIPLIMHKLYVFKNLKIGSLAPDFKQNDSAGNPISLSSLRGKYVLLEFWASWCGPCRAQNPHLGTMYAKYKDKGFTILGVSADKPGDRQKWVDALNKDKMVWPNVSDLRYTNNAAALLYDIHGYPSSFIIDPKGVIIAKDLRYEALENKLREIFGE